MKEYYWVLPDDGKDEGNTGYQTPNDEKDEETALGTKAQKVSIKAWVDHTQHLPFGWTLPEDRAWLAYCM